MIARSVVLLLLAAPAALHAEQISNSSVSTGCDPAVATEGRWLAPIPDGLQRRGHSIVYDSKRGRLVAFGGASIANRDVQHVSGADYGTNDVWVRPPDLSAPWSPLATAGTPPSTRFFHSALYDATSDRMVVYAGAHLGRGTSDLKALDFTTDPPTWVALAASGFQPKARYEQVTLADEANRRFLVYGGVAGDWGRGDYSETNETWELRLDGTPTWTRVFTSGPALGRRNEHYSTYDPKRNRWIVAGGYTFVTPNAIPSNDVFAIDAATNVASRLPDLPAHEVTNEAREMTYDPVRDRLIAYLGDVQGEVWELALDAPVAWRKLATTGPVPTLRMGAVARFDALRNRLILFEGAYSYDPFPSTLVVSFGRSVTAALAPDQGPVNPRSKRPVKVVLFGSAGLAASEIDPASVRVGEAAIDPHSAGPDLVDVDGDGIADLAFRVQARDIGGDAATAAVTATTRIGEPMCTTIDLVRPGGIAAAPAPTGGAGTGVTLALAPGVRPGDASRLSVTTDGHAVVELRNVRGAIVARTTIDGPASGRIDPRAGRSVPPGVYWARVAGRPDVPAVRLLFLR